MNKTIIIDTSTGAYVWGFNRQYQRIVVTAELNVARKFHTEEEARRWVTTFSAIDKTFDPAWAQYRTFAFQDLEAQRPNEDQRPQ